MVSTRNHPRNFPPPTPSPSKSGRSGSSTPASRRARGRNAATSPWNHTPSYLTLIWLVLSLPLIVWDVTYVFLRPRSMPGGSLHRPLWSPYALYGEVDHTYGFVGYESKNGFVEAQSALNVLETAMYVYYLVVVLRNRAPIDGKKKAGRGAPSPKFIGWLGQMGSVGGGKDVRMAVVVAFAASVMTVSKTILYWSREYYSSWVSVGHNNLWNLIVIWIIPNGAWLVIPSYMTYVFGAEILEALEVASTANAPTGTAPSNGPKALTTGAGEDESESEESE